MTNSDDLRQERIRASHQFRAGRFHNTSGAGPDLQGSSLSVFGDFLFGGRKRRPKIVIPVENPLTVWRTPVESGLRVTWLGHSTLLLEIGGLRLLIDPVFGKRASPFRFAGPKRFHPPPVTIAELPPLDAVFLSHDHHDHLNPESIRALAALHVPFITSLGVGRRLESLGVASPLITELDWWETYAFPASTLTITATPAQHFSGRGLFDRNTTLWSSCVFTSATHCVFYSGDTGLTDELREIGERLGPFDLSLIEIGAANAAWADIHLGPVNAMHAFNMLGGGTLLPIHWATFDLALHAWDEPIETLMREATTHNARVLTPKPGQPIEPALAKDFAPWWKG